MTESTESKRHRSIALVALVLTLCGTAFAGIAWLFDQRLSSISEKYEATLAMERQKFHDELRSARSVQSESPNAAKAASPSASGIDSPEQPPNSSRSTDMATRTPSEGYGEVFPPGDVFPRGFDAKLIGMRLSELRTEKPGGKVTRDTYDLKPKAGPFSLIVFWTEPSTEDPKVRGITFYYRDELAFKHIKADAAQKFLGMNVQRRMSGEAFIATVNGIQADLNPDWYSLARVE